MAARKFEIFRGATQPPFLTNLTRDDGPPATIVDLTGTRVRLTVGTALDTPDEDLALDIDLTIEGAPIAGNARHDWPNALATNIPAKTYEAMIEVSIGDVVEKFEIFEFVVKQPVRRPP